MANSIMANSIKAGCCIRTEVSSRMGFTSCYTWVRFLLGIIVFGTWFLEVVQRFGCF